MNPELYYNHDVFSYSISITFCDPLLIYHFPAALGQSGLILVPSIQGINTWALFRCGWMVLKPSPIIIFILGCCLYLLTHEKLRYLTNVLSAFPEVLVFCSVDVWDLTAMSLFYCLLVNFAFVQLISCFFILMISNGYCFMARNAWWTICKYS